jgi:hypothetical protein
MTPWQIAELKISDSKPDKTFNAVTDGFEHTSNLPIDALP